ncbi:MAG: phosphatase PAP2 family protein [Bacteroidota bacterium]|nr:phosphatase PAP2 family protein [Bacteroidota bacterium]
MLINSKASIMGKAKDVGQWLYSGSNILSHQKIQKGFGVFLVIVASVLFSKKVWSQSDTSLPMQQKESFHPNFSAMHTHGTVYKINAAGSAIFSVVATAANIYAIPTIIHGKRNLTDAELISLNPLAPNAIDRWALKQDPSKRPGYFKASDYVLPGIITSATILGFDKAIRKDWAKLLLMFYEMHAVTFALYDFSPFGPAFQNKMRPYSYYSYFSADDRKTGNNRNSLYSGHVASATASTFFMVKVYSDYHPEIGNKRFLLYGLASLPPLFEGYLRVKALAHFPSDVLVGFVIGAVCGVAIPEMHRKKAQPLQLGLYSDGESSGAKLSWNFLKHKKILPNFASVQPKP